MIGAVHTDRGRLVGADIPPDCAAFFDREWVAPDQSTPVPALVFAGNEEQRLADAARALRRIARDAVSAAGEGLVAVVGAGFIAELARRRLATEGRLSEADGSSPDAVIETTGDPSAIIEATRRARSLGTIVLVGEPRSRTYDLDLYPDVHVRGLRLVALGRTETRAQLPADLDLSEGERPHVVSPGEELDQTALWFCAVRPDGT